MLNASNHLPNVDPTEVDRRLADGWTLPAALYTDPAVVDLEDEQIFRPAWHIVGIMADFREPGDYLTTVLGGKYPVVVVKGKDGQLRAFLNVCRHRGGLVVGGDMGNEPHGISGNCSQFRCRYHGWTYGLDGRLIALPGVNENKESSGPNLPSRDQLGLNEVSVDTWKGAVFVSIAPGEPLAAQLDALFSIQDDANYNSPYLDDDLVLGSAHQVVAKVNWKAWQENSIECYHCPITHPNSFVKVLDHKKFCFLSYENGGRVTAPFRDDLGDHVGADLANNLHREVEESGQPAFTQYWTWPANMMVHGPCMGTSIYRIDPIDVNTCQISFRMYGKRGAPEEESARLAEFLGDVTEEDRCIAEGVQLGLRSGAREWGPLVNGREDPIGWFAALAWKCLAPAFRHEAND